MSLDIALTPLGSTMGHVESPSDRLVRGAAGNVEVGSGREVWAHIQPRATRLDTDDKLGKITLRRAGKLHHLGVGNEHAHRGALILVDETSATVTDHQTGEILGTYDINPDTNYWRNKTKKPGRWPGS